MSSIFWKPADGVQRSEDDEATLIPPSVLYSNQQQQSSRNISLAQQRMLLPIYKHRKQIMYAVEEYQCVVIVGATGSGKSTQIPQYLVEAGWTRNDFMICIVENRRIAVTSLAARVAEETGTPLGLERNSSIVGYSVRFDDQTSPQTQIKYVTDGILLREATLHDPLLSKYSVIMVDEAHERTVNSDALLGLLKKIRRKRPDLRIIMCSATIDAQAFLDFFIPPPQESTRTTTTTTATDLVDPPRKQRGRWGDKVVLRTQRPAPSDATTSNTGAAPPSLAIPTHSILPPEPQQLQRSKQSRGTIISVDGRQHEVDVLYLAQPTRNYVEATVETCHHIHQREKGSSGDVLCFLPTGEDIDQAIRLAEEVFFHGTDKRKDRFSAAEFLPLYGSLPQHMQMRVFQQHPVLPPTSGKNKARTASSSTPPRRFIFATNIAETSVTVPNISFVIDSGLVKLPYFCPVTAMDRLIVGSISQASARQRTGRAGRIRYGKCFRMYTEPCFLKEMPAQTPPEILRTNLTSFLLTLKALGVDNILAFDLMDLPSVPALSHGLETLYALGAIDDDTHLTPLGLDLSTFPTGDPRVSRMLLESLSQNCAWDVLSVASALQVRSLFLHPQHGSSSRKQQQMLDYTQALSAIADPTGDHVSYANLLAEMQDEHWNERDCRDRFINYTALQRALEVRLQLAGVLRQFGRIHKSAGIVRGTSRYSRDDHQDFRSIAIRRCVTAGFFFNVARRSNDGHYYTLRNNVLVTPSPSSILSTHGNVTIPADYIVFCETLDGPRGGTGGIELKSVSVIEARWLRELAPHYWD